MRRTVLRGLLSLAAALAMAFWLLATTGHPHLARVLTVTQYVPAGARISPSDLGSARILGTPPPGLVTRAAAAAGQVAQVPLYPGQTLPAKDIAPTFHGLTPGHVRIVLPVSAAQSALVQPGDRVDVLGVVQAHSRTAVVLLAAGVRVLGVYSSSGLPLFSLSLSSTTAPGLVALSVTPEQATSLVPYAAGGGSFWLVADPHGTL